MDTKSLSPADGDTFDVSLAKRIARAVVEAKAAQRLRTVDLAERYNAIRGDDEIQPTTLNNLLAGKRKSITVGELITFCQALDLDPLDVIPELNSRDETGLRDKYRKELIADLLRLP